MRTPSRRMLAAPKRGMVPWTYLALGLALVGMGYYVFRHPYSFFVLVALGALVCLTTIHERRRRRVLALSRLDQSICGFAESLDCRQTDTWIVRATYEEISRFLAIDGLPLPVLADDRLEQDLKIDPDDLEDLVTNIAARAQRSMADTEQNALYGKVRTVRDIVRFLEQQPGLPDFERVNPPGTRRATSPHRDLGGSAPLI